MDSPQVPAPECVCDKCGHRWEADPALTVYCPKCHAARVTFPVPAPEEAVRPVSFVWWKGMPWSASCKDVKGAVPMLGLPTADFDALTLRAERAEALLKRWLDWVDAGPVGGYCPVKDTDALLVAAGRGKV